MCDTNILTSRLRGLIDSSGKTRENIAKELGCDTSTVTKHYNGDRKITVDYVIKYANYFNVSSDYLLGLSSAQTNNKDAQFVCDYTGLSLDSINFLNILAKQNKNNHPYNLEFVNLLNEFISSGFLMNVVVFSRDYILSLNKRIEKKKKLLHDMKNKKTSTIDYYLNDEENEMDLCMFRLQESNKDFIKMYTEKQREELKNIMTEIEKVFTDDIL